MAEPAKYTELPSEDENGLPISRYYTNKRYYFFGTDVLRKDIEELTFSSNDKVPEEAVQSFDLSEKQNKSVMAWYTDCLLYTSTAIRNYMTMKYKNIGDIL